MRIISPQSRHRARNCNSVGVLKSCLTAYELDLMQREIFNALAFHFDDFAFMMHEVVGQFLSASSQCRKGHAAPPTRKNRARIHAAFCCKRGRFQC